MAKTLLGSSDKSNFILNMTEEQYAKYASFGLIAACFTTSLSAILPEVSEGNTYSVCATGLAVSGVICLVLALIAIIKKYVRGSIIVPAAAFAAMLGWGGLSLARSYDIDVGFYGFPQRGEGLLALMFYFGIFVTAASLRRKRAVSCLLAGIVGAGLLNALWALIQIFTGKLMFYAYTDISVNVIARAPSGLSQSPLFLAMVLTLALSAALIVSTTGETEKYRAIATLCAMLFAFVMVFTRTFIGIAGVILSVIIAIAAVFIAKKPKERIMTAVAVIVAAGIGIMVAGTFKSGNRKGYHLYDGYILWSDDAWQRVSACGNYSSATDEGKHLDLDIEDTYDVYTYLNKETIDIIKRYPLDGTGPEQLVYPQIYTYGHLKSNAPITDIAPKNPGTFDKVYNEYLYTAATRGIPSLLFMAAVLISALAIGVKKLRKSADLANAAPFLLTVCGMLVFLIGCSNITFSPIFWACVGAACAQLPASDPKVKAKAMKADRSAKKPEAPAAPKDTEKDEPQESEKPDGKSGEDRKPADDAGAPEAEKPSAAQKASGNKSGSRNNTGKSGNKGKNSK
ncbi:MAG: O-antigen ligase family protein [Ruminococcus sp.]|nr:O-antigen ligase family protein [Ruminococcus sp.]